MTKTIWENIPELQTVAVLIRPYYSQHYKAVSEYFDPQVDNILDIGHNTELEEYLVSNVTSVSENSDLINLDLSEYNTLYFSESVGYLSAEVLEHLISASSIKKILFKDFLSDIASGSPYLSYDFSTMKNIVLPLLDTHNYTHTTEMPKGYTDRWKTILRKNVGATIIENQSIDTAVILATR
jgi:hypothetical protein